MSDVRRSDGQLIAALVPEIVVGEHAALGAAGVAGARLAFLRIEEIAIEALVLAVLERGGFLGRQDLLVLERVGPLQRRDRRERERALEIRFPVWRARRRPLA